MFKTLATDPELKKMLFDDLDRFVRRKEYYRKVGKAWKRGYLLYGPPRHGEIQPGCGNTQLLEIRHIRPRVQRALEQRGPQDAARHHRESVHIGG
ncbi:hypothetical protein NL676_006308 [Syzygium grande]|nr:hypothetical protein NL676_006308 [Syzygium grande]